MAEGTRPALGLSIGATNLAAVTADVAVMRKPVLTLYRQRPPEVGVPSENPRLGDPGLVVTNFVDRVGNSAGIMAADGSGRDAAAAGCLATGMRALNAVPAVNELRPGWVTPLDLPLIAGVGTIR